MAVCLARQSGDGQRHDVLDAGVEILQAVVADRMLGTKSRYRAVYFFFLLRLFLSHKNIQFFHFFPSFFLVNIIVYTVVPYTKINPHTSAWGHRAATRLVFTSPEAKQQFRSPHILKKICRQNKLPSQRRRRRDSFGPPRSLLALIMDHYFASRRYRACHDRETFPTAPRATSNPAHHQRLFVEALWYSNVSILIILNSFSNERFLLTQCFFFFLFVELL